MGSFSLSRASSISRSKCLSYEWVRLFLSEVARQSSDVRWGILRMSHRWGSVAPEEPAFIRENRYSRSHTYSETRAAEGNSGTIGSSSICVRTLRSVS